MSDSLALSFFLFQRVENTIVQRDYIKTVEISFEYSESFGNEYIRLSYVVDVNKKFNLLPSMEQERVSETFKGSPNYIFSLVKHSNRHHKESHLLSRIAEFKIIYLSLASYLTAQFEKHLLPGTFTIQGVDHWPRFNYAEKYYKRLLETYDDYESTFRSRYSTDVIQYTDLNELSMESRKTYLKEKDLFMVTDCNLSNLNLMTLNSIRRILIHWKVAIKVKGTKTIEEILIHLPLFIDALKKEIGRLQEYTFTYNQDVNRINLLIEYLYSRYLPNEKRKIEGPQKTTFIQNFIIQEGDILELTDRRLVIVDSVSLNQNNDTEVTYCLLKADFSKSVRKRTVNINEVSFYVRSADFKDYQRNISIKHPSLLEKWVRKKKKRVTAIYFVPNLAQK